MLLAKCEENVKQQQKQTGREDQGPPAQLPVFSCSAIQLFRYSVVPLFSCAGYLIISLKLFAESNGLNSISPKSEKQKPFVKQS
jgi:hypothetical protein